MGFVVVRTESFAAGGNHRCNRNRCVATQFAQRAHVSNMFGHAKENDDDQGMSASLLFRLYYYGPALGQQGMPDVPQKTGVQTVPATGSEFRSADFENLSQPGRV